MQYRSGQSYYIRQRAKDALTAGHVSKPSKRFCNQFLSIQPYANKCRPTVENRHLLIPSIAVNITHACDVDCRIVANELR